MKLEKDERPGVLRVTLHQYELAALVAAARWVTGGARGELVPEAVEQLQRVVASYDEASDVLHAHS